MPSQWGQADKDRGDDLDGEMTSAIARTGVPDMFMALIDHLQLDRRQRGQRGADQGQPARVGSHGSTCRNGRTDTLAYTPAAT